MTAAVHRRPARLVRRALLAALVAVAGCTVVVDLDPVGAIPAAQAPPVPFPECAAESFDFAGEGTLRGLGLDTATPVVPPDIDRVGTIWVTHDLKPHDIGPPGGPVEETRMLCFEFADGSGGSEWPVDDSWAVPGTVTGTSREAAAGTPALLLAAVVIVVVAGVSFVAFRRPR